MKFTSLNIEQSVARYYADKLLDNGYQVYWWDTKQAEGTAGPIITFVRDFPEQPTTIVFPTEAQEDHLIRVPAFAVKVFIDPATTEAARAGIGEGAFEWVADVRVDGFVHTELQWYTFQKHFTEWFAHPDVRITLRDYQADLTNPAPDPCDGYVQLENVSVARQELAGPLLPAAARYYIRVSSTATYLE